MENVPIWVQALWPILVFVGGMLWFGGKQKGLLEAMDDRMKVQGAEQIRSEANSCATDMRLDRLDLRLTAAETNLFNQSRILDRIEAKLDRLIEARV